MCVYRVSYSTIQFQTCHFLKSMVFNWESTWIDSSLLALLAHRSCKAEWQTRSLPRVKKCVVLFQYSFWSLIYLLHLKKNPWQICWFRTSANTSALRLIKERHVWKVIFWKRKKNQKSDITQGYFFLTCLKIILEVLTAAVASNRFSIFFTFSIKMLEELSLDLALT